MKSNLKPVQLPTQPTSVAVQQLYAKFENLKQRISNSDSKRSTRSIDRRHYVEKQKDSKFQPIGIFSPVPLIALMSQVSDYVKEDQSIKPTVKFSNSQSIISSFTNNLLIAIKRVEQQYIKQTQTLMAKLSVAQQKLTNLSSSIKEKKYQWTQNQKTNQSFTENINNTTRCHTFKSLSENTIQNDFLAKNKLSTEELEQRHRLEIRSIIQNYETRISAMLQPNFGKNLTNQSDSQYLELVTISRIKKLEELLAGREKQNRQLTSENKKLKRMLEQSKMNLERNGELNKLLKEENKILEGNLEKLQAWKKQQEAYKKNDECQVEKLKTELRIRHLQIKGLKEQLQAANISKLHQTNFQAQVGQQSTLKPWPYNPNIFIEHVHMEPEQKSDKLSNFKQVKFQKQRLNCRKRSRSLVVNKAQLVLIQSLRRQSQLISEVRLLEEQNMLLKWKKDKFQRQVESAESDQDKMQQQQNRLKQQIKRLNGIWRMLDDCGLKLLRGESLVQGQVCLLQNDSKLKEEFYRQKEKKKRGFSLRR